MAWRSSAPARRPSTSPRNCPRNSASTTPGTALTCAFSDPGLSGEIAVGKKDVEIHVKLGFLLMALRGRIEREIHAFCDENFGAES